MSSGSDEFQEEPRDYTRWVWLAVILVIAVMLGVLYTSRGPDSAQSLVRVRHILITYNQADPADRSRALELATELRERIANGESMADLAREYSADTFSAPKGGLLDRYPRNQFVPEFEKYAWSAPVGELSDVIATSLGFHIIKVEERYISPIDEIEMERERELNRIIQERSAQGAGTVPADE